MPSDYEVLASIYEILGMSNFADTMTSRLLNYAQQNDWLGRRILDLGCGTGVSAEWFAKHGYSVTGVDRSPEMLDIATTRISTSGISLTWLEQDIRNLENTEKVDLVLSLDVMHELDSLRDLESTFKRAHDVLNDNKMLIFDMYTIEGLTQLALNRDSVLYDDHRELMIIGQNAYDYERQIQTRDYTIFKQAQGNWQRQEARRVLRAYPVQAIATLLHRSGFQMQSVLKLDLSPYEPGNTQTPRVIFVARKV